MGTPAVSVLMTAYNRAPLVGEAIESVLAQTFQDFELIVVDDCSTDATLAVARSYESRDPRVRVIANERNLGDYANRNHAASFARGRYLKYHDSDDLMYPHCLAVMVPALMSEPTAAAALSRGTLWPGAPCPMMLTPRMAYQREFLGSGLFGCGPGGALFSTEAFRALGGFEDVGGPSDYALWVRLCAERPVMLVPADLFWYRVHPGQYVNLARAPFEVAAVARRAWGALHAPSCPLSPDERELAKRNFAWQVVADAIREARGGRWALALAYLRGAGLTAGEWLRYLRRANRDRFAGTPGHEIART